MPFYVFSHPETGETRDVFFHMNDVKVYLDENGVEWKREFVVPQANIDVNIDPYSKQAFLEKTRKAGTFGELFDLSKELSEKRGGKNDPVKKQYKKEWKQKRNLPNK